MKRSEFEKDIFNIINSGDYFRDCYPAETTEKIMEYIKDVGMLPPPIIPKGKNSIWDSECIWDEDDSPDGAKNE